MDELALVLAKYTPEEVLFDSLKEHLTTALITKDEKAKNQVYSTALLVILKKVIGNDDITDVAVKSRKMRDLAERMGLTDDKSVNN